MSGQKFNELMFQNEWVEIRSSYTGRGSSQDWAFWIKTQIHSLSTPCLEYMLSKESDKESNWSDPVLRCVEAELMERILLL
jgi:hypothetical protein